MSKNKRTIKRATPHQRPAKKTGKQHRTAPGQLSFLTEIFALFQAPVK